MALEQAQKINIGQIADMEDEFRKLADLEDRVKSDQAKLARTIEGYTTSAAVYTQRRKMQKMIDEVQGVIEEIAKRGRVRGRVLAKKSLDRYLEASEKSAKTQRTLDAIARANTARARARLDLYADEVLREIGDFRSEVEIFRKRAKLAGFSQKEITRQLVRAAKDKAGPAAGLAKRLKKVEGAVVRREAQAAELAEYRKQAKPNEEYQWITISVKPCPDCQIRAGVTMDYLSWQKRGLPGAGQTICGAYCMCKLMPVSVAEDLFPDVKEYHWDKESGVLTTAGDMRTFGAKSHQPPQKKG